MGYQRRVHGEPLEDSVPNIHYNGIPILNVECYEEEGIFIQQPVDYDEKDEEEEDEYITRPELKYDIGGYAHTLAYLDEPSSRCEDSDEFHDCKSSIRSSFSAETINEIQEENVLNETTIDTTVNEKRSNLSEERSKDPGPCQTKPSLPDIDLPIENILYESGENQTNMLSEKSGNLIENDDGYRSDSSSGQKCEINGRGNVAKRFGSYEDIWKQEDKKNYDFESKVDPNKIRVEAGKRSRSVSPKKTESLLASSRNELTVGNTPARSRSGSVVARRRSIFEIEDQEKLMHNETDPLEETIVILTNAERKELELKEKGAETDGDDPVLKRRGSYGKGLVANRRSTFEP